MALLIVWLINGLLGQDPISGRQLTRFERAAGQPLVVG